LSVSKLTLRIFHIAIILDFLMSFAVIQGVLLGDLSARLEGWHFVKSRRSFERKQTTCVWSLHLAFIKHKPDFDVVADVAVEHIQAGKRLCIVGAELGNICGTGQHRWQIASEQQVQAVTSGILDLFTTVGLPFMERYSVLSEVLRVLRADPAQARLICPLVKDHCAEAALIEQRMVANG
jgi:hypothetical protein